MPPRSELISSADLLFLPMHELPEGTSARIVPCKTYEYLASGRPVLAAVPTAMRGISYAERRGFTSAVRPTSATMAAVAAELDHGRRGGG